MTPPTSLGKPDRHPVNPNRYHETVGDDLGVVSSQDPVCLYLETTNRCNLLCETCPRTFDTLEPAADMSWGLFTNIVDQLPNIFRAVLHGVGEPMMVKNLPKMIRYLKDRRIYVLFNTNGTLLNARKGRELVETGLDELRISLDAADAKSFIKVRGKDFFNRIVRNVSSFTEMQAIGGFETPRVSLWLTGLKETLAELPAFIRLADRIGVREVYLQRLVFFEEDAIGLARPDQSLFEKLDSDESVFLKEAEELAKSLDIAFNASGASEPGVSLTKTDEDNPWSLCRRPWTVMYFIANGRALPCCIAPFAQRGYENYTLGDATQSTLQEIWNGVDYQEFRRALQSGAPPKCCANCGMRWSL